MVVSPPSSSKTSLQSLDIYVDMVKRFADSDRILQRSIFRQLLDIQKEFWEHYQNDQCDDVTKWLALEKLLNQFLSRYIQNLNRLMLHAKHLESIHGLELNRLSLYVHFDRDQYRFLDELLREYGECLSLHQESVLQYKILMQDFFSQMKLADGISLETISDVFFVMMDRMFQFYCKMNKVQNLFKDILNHNFSQSQFDNLMSQNRLHISLEHMAQKEATHYVHVPTHFI